LASVSVLGDALIVAGGISPVAEASLRCESCHDIWVLSLETNVWARARTAVGPQLGPRPALGPLSGAALVVGKQPVLILGGPQTKAGAIAQASKQNEHHSLVVLSLPRNPLQDMSHQLDDVML
jgi:hypothetical protein